MKKDPRVARSLKFKVGDIVIYGLADPGVGLITENPEIMSHEAEYGIFMPRGPKSNHNAYESYIAQSYLDRFCILLPTWPLNYLIIEYINEEYLEYQLCEIIEK